MTDKSDPSIFGEFTPPPLIPSPWRTLKLVEIAATLVALASTMWQLVLLDHSLTFVALLWIAPALLGAFGAVRKRSTPTGRFLATLYLVSLAVGIWVARMPHLLPHLGDLSDNHDSFHQVWNVLPLITRRILAANLVIDSVAIFVFLGYFVFCIPLRDRRSGIKPSISPAICYFGLAVLWGIPALGLLGSLIALLAD